MTTVRQIIGIVLLTGFSLSFVSCQTVGPQCGSDCMAIKEAVLRDSVETYVRRFGEGAKVPFCIAVDCGDEEVEARVAEYFIPQGVTIIRGNRIGYKGGGYYDHKSKKRVRLIKVGEIFYETIPNHYAEYYKVQIDGNHALAVRDISGSPGPSITELLVMERLLNEGWKVERVVRQGMP